MIFHVCDGVRYSKVKKEFNGGEEGELDSLQVCVYHGNLYVVMHYSEDHSMKVITNMCPFCGATKETIMKE